MEKGSLRLALIGRVLVSPWIAVLALVVAFGLGLWAPDVALTLKPAGQVYLALLQMCAMPLVVCGVVASIGRILIEGHSRETLLRLGSVVGVGLFATATLAVAIGLIGQPGLGLGEEANRTLGRLLAASDLSRAGPGASHQSSIGDFVAGLVPTNIFHSLSAGQQVPVLFFAILLGAALGVTASLKARGVLDTFEAAFDALLRMIAWFIYLLPFGLVALLAPQVAEAGVGVFLAMLKLIVFVNVAVVISLLIGNAVIARRVGLPYFKVLGILGESLLVAFATKSSFAAIPSALRAMQSGLRMDKHTTDLVVPLSVSLNPLGNVHYYTISAIFIAQLYGLELTATSAVLFVLGGVLAALAGSALPGAAAVGVISILMEPLGLPVGSAVVLIMAIDPFIDPATTVLNVHASCVASSVVAPSGGDAAAGPTAADSGRPAVAAGAS